MEQKTSQKEFCGCLECSRPGLQQLPLRLVQTSCVVHKLRLALLKNKRKRQIKELAVIKLGCRKISLFVSGELTHLWRNDKSGYFPITKFNACVIFSIIEFVFTFKITFWQLKEMIRFFLLKARFQFRMKRISLAETQV